MTQAARSETNGVSKRSSILGTLSERTRAIALVALVAEALFLGGALSLPDEQRIIAFGICAFLLALAIAACVWLESRLISPSATPGTPLLLPRAMEGHYILVDDATKTSTGQAADIYRTALNLKFAGRFQDAITYFQRTLQLAPEHTKARYNIGSCLLYLGKLDESEQHFQALAKDLEARGTAQDAIHRELLHGCYIQLNTIYSKRGLFAKGVPFLIESLRVKPDDPLSYLNLAIAAVRSGQSEEAKKWHQILFGHPEHIQVLSSLSEEDRTLVNTISLK